MSNRSYRPTVVGLRAFVEVARKRHFGTAAASLGVSQPSLSQALAAMEEGFGVKLVERNTRSVMVTVEGAELLPKAMSALDAIDEFTAAATGIGDPLAGTIRLGIIPTVAPYVLPLLLRGLARELPDLVLQVVEDQTARLLTGLTTGSLDVAVMALPADAAGVTEIPMYDEDFVLALPDGHPLGGSADVDPADLSELPLLLLDEGHCLRDQALEVCRLAGVRPDIGHTRAASLATAVQCVEGGLGVTLIPQTAIRTETASGALRTASFAAPAPGRRIGLVHRATSGRDDSYRILARLVAELVAADLPVTVCDRATAELSPG
ncbi:hydrogen peroxide-inducible genes activator [Williamsia sterculiae]|nr:hydrogen peroxide-inducible genes activator [Williamsia sterculiae]